MSSQTKVAFPLKIPLFIGVVFLIPSAVYSIFMKPDLANTPVERLVENITKQIEKEPANVKLQINLARTHAMAYAKKTLELNVEKRKPNEPWFGYLPSRAPFGEVVELNEIYRTQNKIDAEAMERLKKSADEHLQRSIEVYRKALELDPNDTTVQLGLAWTLDQSGKTEEAVKMYRTLIDSAWDKEKDLEFEGLTFHSIVGEAGTYLAQKLDPEKDKEELAQLQKKLDKVDKIVRPITPIAIPIYGTEWSNVYDPNAHVLFDADGSGQPKNWTWIKPTAGWLVYDHRRAGKISSALQMFGSVTFWCFWDNGYQALGALDDNHDGWLRGDELISLAIWQDANQNGVSELGEVRPLIAYDISGVACSGELKSMGDSQIYCNPQGCERRDGSTLPTYDVILHRAATPVANQINSNAAIWPAATFSATDRPSTFE